MMPILWPIRANQLSNKIVEWWVPPFSSPFFWLGKSGIMRDGVLLVGFANVRTIWTVYLFHTCLLVGISNATEH